MASMSTPQPGVYRKGDSVRVADNASEAVDLVWHGYVQQTPEALVEGLDRPALQAKAKELGIKANQSSEALAAEIAAASVDGDGLQHGTAGVGTEDATPDSLVDGDADTES